MIKLFFKRVFTNKIYWMAVLAALVLLLCSVIYTDPSSGQKYTVVSLFYIEEMQTLLQYGRISIRKIIIGYGTDGYLWMFCPIIVGIPCILTQKTERFVLFRGNKNRYFLSKYISNLMLGGCIMMMAYLLFAWTGTVLNHWLFASTEMSLTQESISDIYILQKLLSVFCQGMHNALLGIILAEFLQNKYLILCIPFVWNYFINMFGNKVIPYEIWQYISPDNYAILFYLEKPKMIFSVIFLLLEMLACGILIKFAMERRCDCGQK